MWYCSSQITWPQATWFHTFWFIWANGIIDETQWILKDFYNPTLYYFPPTWIGLLVWNGPTWYFLNYIFKTEYIAFQSKQHHRKSNFSKLSKLHRSILIFRSMNRMIQISLNIFLFFYWNFQFCVIHWLSQLIDLEILWNMDKNVAVNHRKWHFLPICPIHAFEKDWIKIRITFSRYKYYPRI